MSWRKTSYHVATIEEVGGSVVFSVDRKESKDYMEELQPSGTVDWAFNPHIKMPAFVCFWSCPVGCLPAGDYELVLVVGLDHVATDLGDWDGDGKPDVWGGFWPEGFYVEAHITIHVTP